MDLSTVEQKLDDSKYKTLNEVRMFTLNRNLKNTVEWLLLKILPTFTGVLQEIKIVHCMHTSFKKPLPNYTCISMNSLIK